MSAVVDGADPLVRFLDETPSELFDHPEGRRALTEMEPLLFAAVYLPHHLRDDSTSNQMTFSEFHLDLVEQAKSWVKPLRTLKAYRDAYIAPRECGKSTWLFLILPLWAAAHEHLSFVAAFADSASQAEQHLQTFRHELDSNPLLKGDFPDLCEAAKQNRVSRELAQNRGQIHQSNGFVFMARGIDSANLGMKVGRRRPQLIILDDVEPDEANYSLSQKRKRLSTVQDAVLPLNNFARVVMVGTVTMAGSIIHDLVKSRTRDDEPETWILEENFSAHYYPAIVTNDDGTERSLWPEKWSIEQLQAMRHTRTFSKNFMNHPVDEDSDYWSPSDIRILNPETFGPGVLSIDPAVTTKATSDWTGLAVVSRSINKNAEECYVRHATHVKMAPRDLRKHVIELLDRFEEISAVLVETNQGGDLWKEEIFHGLPVRVLTINQTEPKPVRIQRALNHYQRERVYHTHHHPTAEDEMLSFPNSVHDDIVDAVATGVNFIMRASKKKSGAKTKVRQSSYLGE